MRASFPLERSHSSKLAKPLDSDSQTKREPSARKRICGEFFCHVACFSVITVRERPVAGSVAISSTVSCRRLARNQRNASPFGDHSPP